MTRYRLADEFGITTTNTRLSLKRANGDEILEAVKSALLPIEKSLLTALEHIEADLMPQAREGARREAGKAARAKLNAWIGPKLKTLDENETSRLATIRAAVTIPPSTDVASRMEAALLRAEVRRQAAGLNELQTEILYRTGGSRVRSALEELPQIVVHEHSVQVRPFVSDQVRDEVLLSVGAAQLPDEADALADVRTIRQLYVRCGAILEGAISEAENELAPITTLG